MAGLHTHTHTHTSLKQVKQQKGALASSPCPPHLRRGLVQHCLGMREIFRYIFRKTLRTLPVRMRNIVLLNQEYFELDCTAMIYLAEPFWDTTFQTWHHHFSKRTVQQKGNKPVYQKGPLVATEYLSTICSTSGLNPVSLYNKNGARYNVSEQQIARCCSQGFFW